MPVRESRRFEEIDSLRGLASAVVVLYHSALLWTAETPSAGFATVLKTPLGLLFAGSKAVYLFFIMSGFVLLLPYKRSTKPNQYRIFVTKRVARIYLPYLCALFVAVGADLLFYRPVPDHYAFLTWGRPFPIRLLIHHVLFLGDYPHQFNIAFWSLVQEMRVSLIYPAVAYLVKRVSLISGGLLGIAMVAMGTFGDVHKPFWLWLTVSCTGMFIVGAAIAQHLDRIIRYCRDKDKVFRVMLFAAVMLLIWSVDLTPIAIRRAVWTFPCHVLGIAMLLVLVLATERLRYALAFAPVQWLGKVSYSLYLLHWTVLYSLYCLFWPRLNHVVVLCVGIALSLMSSAVFYRWVELPSMQLGKRLATSLEARKIGDQQMVNS